MWEQIRDNQVRSVILVTALGFMLILLGSLLGQAVLGDWSVGLVLALLIWVVMTLVGYFQGDSILLSISKAHKIGPDDMPRIYNVVEEMKIACGMEKMPAGPWVRLETAPRSRVGLMTVTVAALLRAHAPGFVATTV